MSYGIIPYRVNLKRVAALIGTTDTSTRKKVIKHCSKRAALIDDLADSDNAPQFMEVVEELLDGKATHERYGFMYWYALESFITLLGQRLDNTYWKRIPAGEMDFFFQKFNLFNAALPLPMSIPKPNDMPIVFVLPASEITNDFKAMVVNMMLKRESNYENIQLLEVVEWIESAKRYKQDLVLFYY